MKPRVFIAMASGILGGPGKGLAQFFRHGGLEGCDPLMVAYNRRPDGSDTEFIREMRATGARVGVLRQRGVLDYTLLRQALDLTREHQSMLLQSHGYKSHVLCWLLRGKTGLPWLAFAHGWTDEGLKVRLYNALEHVMLLFADRVVAVSESVRSRLLPPVRGRCMVIPNAVSVEEPHGGASGERDVRRELSIPADALVAGVVGRLSPEKGHMIFLRALAEARKREPRLHGLILGQGPEREALEKELPRLDLSGHCVFAGHVLPLLPYYNAMDMLVVPSFREGMPNAALEGMAMGLPLAASAVGGVPEVVRHGETGLLLPPGDVPALADALLRLAGNAQERARLGKAGREYVAARHAPKTRTQALLTLYAGILDPYPPEESR